MAVNAIRLKFNGEWRLLNNYIFFLSYNIILSSMHYFCIINNYHYGQNYENSISQNRKSDIIMRLLINIYIGVIDLKSTLRYVLRANIARFTQKFLLFLLLISFILNLCIQTTERF